MWSDTVRTYKLFISIQMYDDQRITWKERHTTVEERDFACASHEEAQELLALAAQAVEDSR